MLGLSPKDAWLAGLLLVSVAAFLASARWSNRLAEGRALVAYSICFSLAFAFLALLAGLAVFRD